MQKDLKLTEDEKKTIKEIALNEYLSDNKIKQENLKKRARNSSENVALFNNDIDKITDIRNKQLFELFASNDTKMEAFREWIDKWWQAERIYRNKMIGY